MLLLLLVVVVAVVVVYHDTKSSFIFQYTIEKHKKIFLLVSVFINTWPFELTISQIRDGHSDTLSAQTSSKMSYRSLNHVNSLISHALQTPEHINFTGLSLLC